MTRGDSSMPLSRRDALISASALAASLTFRLGTAQAAGPTTHDVQGEKHPRGLVPTDDGVQIFYKDWGPRDAQPIVFHHGWPLSSDDWDAQMMYFLNEGFRVIAHDRRGHGRSTQTDTGNEMDTYAADVTALA